MIKPDFVLFLLDLGIAALPLFRKTKTAAGPLVPQSPRPARSLNSAENLFPDGIAMQMPALNYGQVIALGKIACAGTRVTQHFDHQFRPSIGVEVISMQSNVARASKMEATNICTKFRRNP